LRTIPDENRTTETTYTPDGQIKTLTAKNNATGDQVTTWVYGTTLSDSDVARADLLRAKEYPDSSGPSDRVEYKYDRQGETKSETQDVTSGFLTHPLYQYVRINRSASKKHPLRRVPRFRPKDPVPHRLRRAVQSGLFEPPRPQDRQEK
jgi:hypothetical protein